MPCQRTRAPRQQKCSSPCSPTTTQVHGPLVGLVALRRASRPQVSQWLSRQDQSPRVIRLRPMTRRPSRTVKTEAFGAAPRQAAWCRARLGCLTSSRATLHSRHHRRWPLQVTAPQHGQPETPPPLHGRLLWAWWRRRCLAWVWPLWEAWGRGLGPAFPQMWPDCGCGGHHGLDGM
jgi:hypothetical protein